MYSRAEVDALVAAAARKGAAAASSAISNHLKENSLLIAKGANIGVGTHDVLQRVMSFESSDDAVKRSADEPRRPPHRAFRDDSGSCTIGRATADACELKRRTLPTTIADVNTCTRLGIFKVACDIWQRENDVIFELSTQSRKPSEFMQAFCEKNGIMLPPPQPRAQVKKLSVDADVGDDEAEEHIGRGEVEWALQQVALHSSFVGQQR
jgi:hypothetical protein